MKTTLLKLDKKLANKKITNCGVIKKDEMYYASFLEDSILFDINGNILKKIAGSIYSLNDDLYGFCSTKTKYGFIDKQGNLVIEAKYDDIDNFNEGLARVKLNEKYGFIDKQGNLVIEAKYNYVDDFSEGLAMVELNEKYGFIDKQGNLVIETEYDVVLDLVEGAEYNFKGFGGEYYYSEILKFDTNLFLLKKGEELKLKNLN
ncbi:WG repeat-containing protein [Campylobacter lari]|uniref:WG repeat-containing protein n=1 Tax=Campylobacter lari TaxID=201 RepID=UPI00126C0F04|nr:WG repeat-containing protein [Campylobacter lari]EAI4827076.1 WG repeat-containing protein [Campylobacter lari]EAJ9525730.1 WG repeat-containing protein [Campylobacter lari]EAK0134070.1 WG repeat-containing protein [Campylobacter lari]EGH7234121.1 WG repeat-containing protein [Campylobacter lari]EGJ2904468.1 WG repeat-containing protein [Campylobacter lari]